ncbi:response regulator [Paenibacillus sp. BC26]|uniref:response regulator transcription factor n=1 Tax=Paenibacillus sp. BC26 TaxID=1881032 RepID=UPI0015A515EF|nr:response regulator [Paenibacillus sp. BC26]
MIRMLLVDDDQFERDGVKFLIDEYGLDLEVYEAENGEQALAFIVEHPVDILLTDIRMDEMDGLQLAEKVRELNLPIKVIFLSAYGEFEYAQKAIDLKASKYILKPVQISGFLKEISKVMQLCEEERRQSEHQERILEVQSNGMRYERQRLISNLLRSSSAESRDLSLIKLDGSNQLRMILLDSNTRIFDLPETEDFEKSLEDFLPPAYDVVQLNEFQCLVFISAIMAADESKDLLEIGQQIRNHIKARFKQDVFIIFSGAVDGFEQLRSEYNQMESILENKFFLAPGSIQFTSHASIERDNIIEFSDQMLEDMIGHIGRQEFTALRMKFEQFFEAMQSGGHFSAVYVKYICSEVMKKIYDLGTKKSIAEFQEKLEQIYRTPQLNQLKAIVGSVIDQQEQQHVPPVDNVRKVIENIVGIIEQEYHTDIALEDLAERVFLNPSYLSHLFKKHKGVSIIKYMTEYRLEVARNLITDTNRKIIDISQQIGYPNFPYFCTLFKNYYGVTPSQFRERLGS